jgi:hypothetical protein
MNLRNFLLVSDRSKIFQFKKKHIFSAPLVSKNESLEASSLASFRALVRQITNGEIILNIVQYLFNILNGLRRTPFTFFYF